MGTGQSVGDSNGEVDDSADRRLLAPSPFTKCAAVDEFGDQVLTAFKLSRVVYRQNVWMAERRGHLCFPLESPAG